MGPFSFEAGLNLSQKIPLFSIKVLLICGAERQVGIMGGVSQIFSPRWGGSLVEKDETPPQGGGLRIGSSGAGSPGF